MSGPPHPASVTHIAAPRRGRHGRTKAPLWAIIAIITALLLGSAFIYKQVSGSPQIDDKPVGKIADGMGDGWAAWGFTHTENSLEQQPAASTAVGTQKMVQAQHIMGFGTLNPQETPGRFDWTSLDRRIGAIRATNGVPVITLCCAPDWMKGGEQGKTDWNHLTDAPTAQFFDAFAEQAAEVARRYPDVKHYFVWNEFKGFYKQADNRWDYEGYTNLYNKVYDALKKVNSDIKVGGPYLVVNSYADKNETSASSEIRGPWGSIDQRAINALEYWYKNKKGADFVVVDGSTLPEDRRSHEDEFAALGKFSALTRWLRAKGDLPVVWSEWYVEPENSGWTAERLHAVQAAAMIEFAMSGAAGALYWSPQGSANCTGCLWNSGGQALPALRLQQNFAKWFAPGTELMQIPVSSEQVRVLASKQQLVAVNTTGQAVQAKAGDVPLDLKPYEVRWMNR